MKKDLIGMDYGHEDERNTFLASNMGFDLGVSGYHQTPIIGQVS
jgi:hypothetical protein